MLWNIGLAYGTGKSAVGLSPLRAPDDRIHRWQYRVPQPWILCAH